MISPNKLILQSTYQNPIRHLCDLDVVHYVTWILHMGNTFLAASSAYTNKRLQSDLVDVYWQLNITNKNIQVQGTQG